MAAVRSKGSVLTYRLTHGKPLPSMLRVLLKNRETEIVPDIDSDGVSILAIRMKGFVLQ